MSEVKLQSTRAATSSQLHGTAEQTRQYLTFLLGGESFAIGILAVKEIIEYSPPTQVPMMPGYLAGVINLRGAVVPVVDLMVRFGRRPGTAGKRTCFVIVEVTANGERQDVGVLVDAVDSVLDIPLAQIEPPPAFGTKIATQFIGGMAKVNGRFVILLDVAYMLAAEEVSMLAQTSGITEAAA